MLQSAHPWMVRSLLVTALLALTACGGSRGAIEMPLAETRELNTEIRLVYATVTNLLETTQSEVNRVRTLPEGVTDRNVDLGLVRQVAQDCFTQTVTLTTASTDTTLPGPASALAGEEPNPLTRRADTGRARSCQPNRMMVLESYLEALPGVQREFVVERILLTDRLRVNLNDVIVQQLDNLERARIESERQLQGLRQVAEQRLAQAQHPRVHAEDRRRAEIDYESVIQELEQVESVVAEIASQMSNMRHLRRQLIDEASRNISQMGTR